MYFSSAGDNFPGQVRNQSFQHFLDQPATTHTNPVGGSISGRLQVTYLCLSALVTPAPGTLAQRTHNTATLTRPPLPPCPTNHHYGLHYQDKSTHFKFLFITQVNRAGELNHMLDLGWHYVPTLIVGVHDWSIQCLLSMLGYTEKVYLHMYFSTLAIRLSLKSKFINSKTLATFHILISQPCCGSVFVISAFIIK